MNKFNRKTVVFKKARDSKANRKRQNLAERSKGVKKAVSGARTGKHKRQVERKWAKAQKEALEAGLLTADDIQMIVQQQDDAVRAEEEPASAEQERDAVATVKAGSKGRSAKQQKAGTKLKGQRASLRIQGIAPKVGRAGKSSTSVPGDVQPMME